MFYEMDGSFHRDGICSQAGRMEHPCGSGAESPMPSAGMGVQKSVRGGPGTAAHSARSAGSGWRVSIPSATSFYPLQQQ